MCTAVVRWAPGEPVRVLALRDELVGRDFDDPGAWWPDHPDAVGGRDRSAGGTWCASDVRTGLTGMVLNRAQRRVAEPGAPSRGVLPLLALARGANWPTGLRLEGMASFALALASPSSLTCWLYDGEQLTSEDLGPGTHMVTSGGAEDGKAEHYLDAFRGGAFPEDWMAQLRDTTPLPDPAALVVRAEFEDKVYATVFGQLLVSEPGRLDLQWTRTPWGDAVWSERTWSVDGGDLRG